MAADNANGVVTVLRNLALSDPKQAREVFAAVLRNNGDLLTAVLEAASCPGDSRLRQIVAIVCRTSPHGGNVLEPVLRKWASSESDEFTKKAILAAISPKSVQTQRRAAPRSAGPGLVEVYRYIADRLCHRIRNAMALPVAHIDQLEQLAMQVNDADLRGRLIRLKDGIRVGLGRISRNVEFDMGDRYHDWQPVPLVAWLEANQHEFCAKYGTADFTVHCDSAVRHATVAATPFLLETTFGNLWLNAIQATRSPHTISVEIAFDTAHRRLELFFVDNGEGFSAPLIDTVFEQVFSTKGSTRGRGLLEVADAVTQLHGTVQLAERRRGEYRVRIVLPVGPK